MILRFYLVLIFFGAMGVLQAQHHHYMFIQADQQQPFYVKMGTELLSSSRDGFLIVPRLKDSAYEMIIGFPEKKFPEYRFRFAGFRKDRGMALKNFQEKGWGLFDYQSLEVQMGERQEMPQPAANVSIPQPITNDAFTVILASVIGDPGLLATPLIAGGAMPAAVASNAVVKTAMEPTLMVKPDPLPAPKDTMQALVAAAPEKPAGDSAQTPLLVAESTGKETEAKASPTLTLTADEDSIRQAAQEATTTEKETTVTKPSETAKKKKTAGAFFAGTFRKKEKTADPAPRNSRAAGQTGELAGQEKPSLQTSPAGTLGTESPKPVAGISELAPSIDSNTATILPPGGKTEPAPSTATGTASATPPAVTASGSFQGIRMKEEKSEESGLRRTYLDTTDGLLADTVDVFIPFALSASTPPVEEEKPVAEKPLLAKTGDITVKDSRKDSISLPVVSEGTGKKDRIDCRKMATQSDVNALRRRMVSISDEDEMVMAALKDIKLRCYTTVQVRDICAVFTRDEGRYKLIDAAYPYVYDPSQYESLEFLLSDKYFIHRFKALIQK